MHVFKSSVTLGRLAGVWCVAGLYHTHIFLLLRETASLLLDGFHTQQYDTMWDFSCRAYS